MKKKITIFGSTGSIGLSTLDIISQHNDKYEIVGLSINNNYEKLLEQVSAFKPKIVSIKDTKSFEKFKNRNTLKNLKINPKGRVPALITEKGILTETPAMLAYLAQIAPDQNLAPTDPFEFAIAQAINSYMASTVHVAHAHKHRGARWADDPLVHEAMRAKVTANMTECAQIIEKHYLKA